MTRRLAVLAIVGVGCLLATPGWAQSDKKGAATVIMQFDRREVEQEIMDTFYRTLNAQIDASDDMHVVSGGETTIKDVILMAGSGCKTPKPKCLKPLSSYISGQRIVFGSVQRTENIYLFSMKMFDFVEERFVRQVPEQTVEGDISTVKEAIPGIVEGFLHGDVGKVSVQVAGADDTTVKFDGKTMGPGPTTLDNLPLGQHAVTVETANDQSETKMVTLRRGKPVELQFQFQPQGGGGADPQTPRARSEFSSIPGWASAGVGMAGIITGIAFQARLGTLENESSRAVC